MTTPTGTITMLDVIEELDGAPTPRQITLNDADVRGLAGVPTGEISMDDLRGKSSRAAIFKGRLTVGTSSLTTGWTSLGIGSMTDEVYGDGWDGVANPIVAINYDGNSPDSNIVKATMLTDLTARLNILTVVGHGRDLELILNEKIWLDFLDEGFASQKPADPDMFTAADVGLTFDVAVYDQ